MPALGLPARCLELRCRPARGATAVEYALMLTMVAAVIFGTVALFGGGVSGLFSDSASSIDSAVTP